MRVAIDPVGRLIVPKALRNELGLHGPTEVEMTAIDGRLGSPWSTCPPAWSSETASR